MGRGGGSGLGLTLAQEHLRRMGGELFKQLSSDSSHLMRQEINLAKAELMESAGHLAKGATKVGVTYSGDEAKFLEQVAKALEASAKELGVGEITFVLQGEQLGADTSRPLLGRPTPCVGREQELAIAVAVVTVLAAFLMVSNFRYYSFKELDLKGRVPFVAILVLLCLGVARVKPGATAA